MYHGRKRPRPSGDSSNTPYPSSAASAANASSATTPLSWAAAAATRVGATSAGIQAASGTAVSGWDPAAAAASGTFVGAAKGVGGAGSLAGFAAPARYYTSTQPDIEDADSGGDGRSSAGASGSLGSDDGGGRGEAKGGVMRPGIRGSVAMATMPRPSPLSPPLFSREELAPSYHLVAGSCNNGGGGCNGGCDSSGSSDVRGPGVGVAEIEGGGGAGCGSKVVLGCPHYRRACKMRAPCCQRLFTCRLCHDQASDHTVDREEVKEMLCMRCGTLQPMHR